MSAIGTTCREATAHFIKINCALASFEALDRSSIEPSHDVSLLWEMWSDGLEHFACVAEIEGLSGLNQQGADKPDTCLSKRRFRC
jgi:hypothetical protein